MNTNDSRFKYRVAGIAIHDGKVLLYRHPDNLYWSLPGGQVELMETAQIALVREFNEETGLDVQPGKLIWITENFYKKKKHIHELAFYFMITVPLQTCGPDDHPSFSGQEGDDELDFRWFLLEELDNITLYPSFLVDRLKNIPDSIQHIIITDNPE